MTNHLWQSTVFAAGVALLTWALRNHRASVRYALWFSASVKFLVPFALFMSLGGQAEPAVAPFTPPIAQTVKQFTVPFPEVIVTGAVSGAGGTARGIEWTLWILAAWSCGVLAVAGMRLRAGLRVRALVRASQPHPMKFPIQVRTSSGIPGPGLVGLWRCTILLPEGIERHLTREQLDAVLAHELAHAKRRDNLMAAVHMAVEALFWFHPLVWWIGARLDETRELACDEAVLAGGGNPREYAEAILNVCKRYVEPPLACVSGITGADLKKRMEAIFSRRVMLPLSWSKRALLASAASIALLVPFVAGIVNAQSSKSFEVVSIHPLPPHTLMPIVSGSGGLPPKLTESTFEYTGAVYGLIVRAYGLRSCRSADYCNFLLGGPAWIRTDKYKIDAKLPEGSPRYDSNQYEKGGAEGLYPMVQSMLADRFGLKVHRESKEVPIYALTLGPGGHKLTPTEGKMRQNRDGTMIIDRRMGIVPLPGPEGVRRYRMTVTNFTLQELADALSDNFDRPVLDRTGTSGRFDFAIEYEGDAEVKDPFLSAGGPGLITAFREQLGLRLQPTQGPVDVVAIDSIERPSEN